ncbi:MAG: hydroxyacid dehydrogenase [Candidatus ainarchaeum sp.]|nr:hydroxyacid dehydrogenase [Candidatus ainarchaeum sp.]
MKIVIADNMESEVVEEIKELGEVAYKPADLKASVADADALIVRSATQVNAELLSHAKKLKIVARAGVGLDNVDAKECEKRGIKVVNTPGAPSNAVAELCIGFMIMLLRNGGKAHAQMKNKVWDKKSLTGREIAGKTLGVIGFGRIGALVAEKAHGLGMDVIAYDRSEKKSAFAKFVSLDELFAKSDVISLHLSLTEENRNLVNAQSIGKMKNGVCIINTARGGLVDENAFYEACKAGKIGGVALDVYEPEPYSGKLLELENAIFTPHIGSSTKESQERIGKELVQRLKEMLG